MIKGGYHILNLGDNNLTAEAGATITGAYSSIEGSYRKPVLLSGVTISGVEKRDCFVCPELSGDSYTFTAHGYTFSVSSADEVTIAAAG